MNSFRLLAAALFLAAIAPRAAAQCAGIGDGLDGGPACTNAFTQVTQPKFAQPALGICWQNCGPSATQNYRAQWGNLVPMSISTPGAPPPCGWYTSSLLLLQASIPKWAGGMQLTYSRTWTENASSGASYQVWRYLVNGDLRPVNANPGPCAVPPCAASFGGRVRFTGYIDYAMNCAVPAVTFEHAWMITHACDTIDHAAGYPRAGVFHPGRFYSFVGPRAGFAVGVGSTLENGATATECVRKLDALVAPTRCDHEEPLLFGTFNPNSTLCLCGVGPSLWYEAFFNAAGNAGTTVTPYLGSDPFRSFPIGTWTNPNAFPGVEEVRWNTNDLAYTECTGFSRNEYYFGVTTAGGYPAFTVSSIIPAPPPSSLPTTFVDQSNSVLLPANVTTRNIPYKSDHILNLNL